MLPGMTEETLALARLAFGGGRTLDQFRKDATTAGFLQSTGLVWYDLEAQAKELFPALTPLRNRIPRVGLTGPGFGTAANWKSILNINSGATPIFGGVSEGNRGAVISTTEKDFAATYKGIGLENFASFEAQYAGEGYDDILARLTRNLLQAAMVEEEKMILWGNAGLALGTTPTPVVADGGGTTGGFGTTPFVRVCAVTPLGLLYAGGLLAPTIAVATNTVIDQITRANADGTSDVINGGHAIVSAEGTATITAAHFALCTVAGVKGAAAYVWYSAAVTGAANQKLSAITAGPTVTLTGPGNAANQAANFTGNGSDRSQNALSFDGLITQCLTSSGWAQGGIFNQLGGPLSPAAGGGYYKSLAAALTFSGVNCVEIDNALKWFWDAYRLWPDEIWVSAYQAMKITNGLIGSSAPSYRINVNGGVEMGSLTAGALVVAYLNKFTPVGAISLPIRVHPFMPDSWIYFHTNDLGQKYPQSNVASVARIKARREWYSVQWPRKTRKDEFGVYADEVLEVYAPVALGLLADVL